MNAQDKVMTIDNQTPGWLSSKMTYAQQVAVEDLTVTGYINPTDMEFINGLIGKRNLNNSSLKFEIMAKQLYVASQRVL